MNIQILMHYKDSLTISNLPLFYLFLFVFLLVIFRLSSDECDNVKIHNSPRHSSRTGRKTTSDIIVLGQRRHYISIKEYWQKQRAEAAKTFSQITIVGLRPGIAKKFSIT